MPYVSYNCNSLPYFPFVNSIFNLAVFLSIQLNALPKTFYNKTWQTIIVYTCTGWMIVCTYTLWFCMQEPYQSWSHAFTVLAVEANSSIKNCGKTFPLCYIILTWPGTTAAIFYYTWMLHINWCPMLHYTRRPHAEGSGSLSSSNFVGLTADIFSQSSLKVQRQDAVKPMTLHLCCTDTGDGGSTTACWPELWSQACL